MRINLNKMQKFWHTKYFKTGNNSLKNKGLENNKILDRSIINNSYTITYQITSVYKININYLYRILLKGMY